MMYSFCETLVCVIIFDIFETMELIKLVEKWLDKILPIGLILACFIIILTRIPFYDEAHSFLLSSFSFRELFEISRIE